MNFKEKYGPVALIAGASEGLGAAWAEALAEKGLYLVLVARRMEPLEAFAIELKSKYSIQVSIVSVDLSEGNALEKVKNEIGQWQIGFLVYNAAISFIGPFLETPVSEYSKAVAVNILSPIHFVHYFGGEMVKRGKGGIVIMASMAGFQGSGFLTTYSSTKAFDRVFAEGLWYEWKDKGVDVIACCAGATSTPNYNNTKPKPLGFGAPKVLSPDEVVKETLPQLGKVPSFIPGTGNRWASFFMQRIMPRKLAITIMGDTTKGMYDI